MKNRQSLALCMPMSRLFKIPQRSGRAGFTLIELLVVVAIIVVLIALMMPALARAREQSKTLVCSANLRQLGTVIFAYADENGGYGSPANYYRNGIAYNGFAGYLGRYLWPYTNQIGSGDLVALKAHFTTGAGKIFVCPNNLDGVQNAKKSYLANGNVLGRVGSDGLPATQGKKLMAINAPYKTFTLIENWQPTFDIWQVSGDEKMSAGYSGLNVPAHKLARHYLHVDGHVELILMDPGLTETNYYMANWR